MQFEDYTTPTPRETNESFRDKALRELELTGIGLRAVPNAAQEAFTERPIETSAKFLAAAGISAVLGYAGTKVGPLGYAARTLGIGFGVSMIGDFGRNLGPAAAAFGDNWHSGANWNQNVETMEKHFAPFVFDTALTVGGAAAGGYAGTVLGRPRFTPTLPEFTAQGYLPPGIHKTSWAEFATRYGTTPRRQDLLANMEALLHEAKAAGADKVYAGGSLVTAKETPRDFDLTWRIEGKRIGELRQEHPILIDRALQDKKLGGQLIPTYPDSPRDGIVGFLQTTRKQQPVGIVELDLSTLPSRFNYRLRSLLGNAGVRPIPEIAKTEPLTPMPKDSPYN